MLRSTLWGFKGNNPEAAHPASMFLLVIALSLAGWLRYNRKHNRFPAPAPARFSAHGLHIIAILHLS
jgi:hypothetical protein